jgi:OOP family OmpA-OmpF porin
VIFSEIASLYPWFMMTVMEQEFRWSEAREVEAYRLPGPDHLGRWAALALAVSVLLHVALFFSLDRVKIAFGIMKVEELSTGAIDLRPLEVTRNELESLPPTENVITPPNDSAALLDEVDLLDMLPKETEIDITTDAIPEYALKMSNPLAEGELDAVVKEVASTFNLEENLPDFGRMPSEIKPAAAGQIIVDPGAVQVDDGSMSKFTDDLIKRGNRGLVDQGKLEGIESLDQLLDLPANLLLSKKTLLPSDLLFEFNRAELRESAKVGLMKLGFLIEKNPTLYCWIEGHTDLIGSDETNFELSEQRAEAVKNYLVDSMRMDPERIITRGFGKTQPLITEGDKDFQAPNRRVEIRMRKTPPPAGEIKRTPEPEPVAPPRPEPVPQPRPEAPKEKPAEPVNKAIPVEEPEPPKAEVVPPRAEPIEELPVAIPRAVPTEP